MHSPRHQRLSRLPLFALVSTVSLAACAVGAATNGEPAPRESGGSTQPTPGAGPASGATEAITVTIGGSTYAATLADNPAARDLAAQLPLTLTFRDYNRVEKIATLPRVLSTHGLPAGADPDVNDIGYYAPTGDLVLYYGSVGYWDGIVRLGILPDGMPEIASQPDGFTATFARA